MDGWFKPSNVGLVKFNQLWMIVLVDKIMGAFRLGLTMKLYYLIIQSKFGQNFGYETLKSNLNA